MINKDAETAVVYYAVADYSGNVTKQSRDNLDGNETLDVEEDEMPQLTFGNAASSESTSAGSEASTEKE